MTARSNAIYNRDDSHGRYVPADLLLLQGSALVDEASLTGESVPQRKSMLNNEGTNLDIGEEQFKCSIAFGGTILLNHSVHSESMSGQSQRFTQPPDGGCIFFVLRTGYETLQGSLLRNIVHTTTKTRGDGVNTSDTFIFIVLLLLCALGSSLLVLHAGWNDPTRNRFKLLLHVIMILTSVVPPEVRICSFKVPIYYTA